MFSAEPDLQTLHAALGIPPDYALRGLPYHAQARVLVPLGLDTFGRDQFAEPAAASAWQALQAEAARDGVPIVLVSAFRSIAYQAGLIRRKLEKGQPIADILRVSAAPGCSEHHTGRAFDLADPQSRPLETVFETTPAFAWLQAHAARFGFHMSYPPDNPWGIDYEPWHWCYSPVNEG